MLLCTGVAQGQIRSGVRLDFQFCRLVLVNGDTLSGPVAVCFGPDLLYMGQPDGSVRTFAPASVAAFAVQGEKIMTGPGRPHAVAVDPNLVRLFRTLTWPSEHPGEQRPEPAFFEQLSEGPVLLVRRQVLTTHLTAINPAGSGRPSGPSRGAAPAPGKQMQPGFASVRYDNVVELKDEYFLAWATGELIPLRKPKKDLLTAFPQQAQQVQTYAKTQGIGYGSARELHELVSYANSLLVLATQ
ncbi:hypothetical protein [Hymenobacter rubidus]|uniref:hypothetical protein n=1 Tax=Hymenobacter rubidus TaxID=1441626 RepID=UPI00191D5D0A|nr:hypothetical protein [Hymenobacter rubidus]